MTELESKRFPAAQRGGSLKPQDREPSRPIFGRALQIFTLPARLMSRHAERHYRRRYHGRYRFARQIFILDVILLGLILSLAAFVSAEFLARPRLPETVAVEMTVTPRTPRSGDRVTLIFSYENRSRAVQEEVEIGLRLPRGFLPDRTDIPNFQPETRVFSAGSLPPGVRGEFEIGGVLLAVPGEPFQAAAVTSARDGRSGAVGIRAASFSFPVGPSALAADLTLPGTVSAGQDTVLFLSYRNEGNATIDQAVVVPILPEGVLVAGSEPELISGSWQISELGPGSSGKLTLRLRWPPDAVWASAEVGLRLALRAEDQLIPQGELLRTVSVIVPGVKLISSAARDAVGPGDTLHIRIEAENNGTLTWREAALRLVFEPAWVDLDSAVGGRRDGPALLITSAEIPGLAAFRPGDRLAAEVSLRLNSEITLRGDEKRPLVLNQQLTLEGEVDKYGRIIVSAEPAAYPVSSSLGLRTAVRYFTAEGDQIGRGPLPPEAGKKTRYWIFFEARSAPNEARNVVVEGKLAAGVAWTGQQSVAAPGARPVVYDPAAGVVRWEIPRLGGAVGEAPFGAALAVDFLPTAEQAGAPAVLLESVTIRGVDDPTGKVILYAAPDVTTEESVVGSM